MYLTNRRFLAVMMLALVLVLTHCQQDGSGEKAGKKVDQIIEKANKKIEMMGETTGKQFESVAASFDDSAITAKIKAEIIGDPLLKVAQIEVSTNGGVVKLEGTVNSQRSFDRIEEIVNSIKEVKSVDNHLVIKGF